MKKVLSALTVLSLVCWMGASPATAAQGAIGGALAGTWDVQEDYSGQVLTSTWQLTTLVANFDSLVATRTPANIKRVGVGIEGLRKSTLMHRCYGQGCGSCNYTFVGTLAGETLSGTANYRCSDGTDIAGTFTATKVAVGAEESGAGSDRDVDPR